MEPRHARAGQPLAKVGRERPAQILAPHLDPAELAPHQHPGEAANGRFNFGKFGHVTDMAAERQAR
jgi:hypothetical protein